MTGAVSTGASVSVRQKVAGNVVLAVGTSVWGTHFLVTDILLAGWDPYFLTLARLLSATGFLLTFLTLQSRGRPLARVPWKPALLLGSAGIAVSTVLLTLGVKYAGAVPASIVAAAAPIVAAFVARAGFGIPLTLGVAFGAVIAVTGGVIAALGSAAGGIGTVRGGELFILAAITLFTWYSIGAQRWLTGLSQLGITAITIMIGAMTMVVALPVLVGLGIAETRFELSWSSVAFILYLGAGPASFSLFTWHWGVSRVGVTIASIYSNLVPVVVVAIRTLEGIPPTTGHVVGGILIITGVLVAQLLPSGRSRLARRRQA